MQGVGGRVSGLLSTTIQVIIEYLREENVLDPENAGINQIQGVLKAIDMGYKRIAVTVVSADDVKRIREIEKQYEDVKVYIFVAHASGVSEEDARIILEYADVVTGCASKYIRGMGVNQGLFKAGDCIPIFGISGDGINFLERRIDKIGGLKEKEDVKIPKPLI